MRFFAPCPPGAEKALAREIESIGAASVEPAFRGVGFEGDTALAYTACLYLRTASRLLVEMASGPARDEDELYRLVKQVPWEAEFPCQATIACRATGVPRNRDPRFAVLRVKDAVCDRFVEREGDRPSVDRRQPDIRIEARWNGRRATVFLNWSGPPLHERGYRLEKTGSALRETTAAAVLGLAGWPEAAADEAFVDPVCGSGTLLVEAAMMAAGMPPGVHRKRWGFLRCKNHDEALWERLLKDASIRYGEGMEKLPPIVGCDIDHGSLRIARANVRRAGLNHVIRLEQHDIRNGRPRFWPMTPRGLLCADPPFGHRSSDDPKPVYAAIASVFETLHPGWRMALLAPDRETAAVRPLQSCHNTVSGGMDLVLALYGEPRNPPAEAARAIPPPPARRGPQHIPDPKAPSLRKALKRNIEALSVWAGKTGVTSYRIWDSDMPEFNAAVDWYEGRWLHVQEFAAPAKVPKEKTQRRLNTLLTIVKELTGCREEDVYLKTRQRGRRPYGRMGSDGALLIVREKDVRYYVNFTDYLDTGLFLDHRPTRAMIQRLIGRGAFLNLFSYTGTATVAAALGGAAKTVSIDVSNTYHRWARENMKLNRVAGNTHRFIRSDAAAWLRENRDSFDLIFMDPPTYSNGAGREDWSVQDHHAALIRMAMKRLSPGGTLLFSENFRQFTLDRGLSKDFTVKEITGETLHPDFARRGRSHRCWKLTLP